MFAELTSGEIYLSILLAVIGAGSFGVGVFLRWRAASSRNWPWTMGTVVNARIREEVHVAEHGRAYSRYYPEVAYEYVVEGRTYRSKRIRFGGLPFVYSTDREEIETWLADYPGGRQVQVYYHPQRPEEAVLQPGGSTAAAILIVVGLGGLLGSAVVLLSAGVK